MSKSEILKSQMYLPSFEEAERGQDIQDMGNLALKKIKITYETLFFFFFF